MLSLTIAALQKLQSAENQTLPTSELLRLTGFCRSDLFRIFGHLEASGIVSQTGYTFFGDIQGYRLEKSPGDIPLLAVLDAVEPNRCHRSVPPQPSTEGSRRYETARAAFEQTLAAITLGEFQ